MRKVFLRIGSIMAFFAVVLGAFAAHGLEGKISPEHLHNFETGARYQMYHALAILIIGVLIHFRKTSLLTAAGWFFLVGIVLFSGSLYLLALDSVLHLPISILGPITPIGGLCQLIGWLLLFFSTYKRVIKFPSEEE